jgi:AmmeMemoRadiSam system protein B
MGMIREAAVSGAFYPDDPKVLVAQIKRFLDNADFDPIEGEITGIISPHAGYVYSGQVAAYGMKAISRTTYDTVVVIAPSHRMAFDGVSIMEKGKYRTPLGLIDIDEEMAAAVIEGDHGIFPDGEAHILEHAVEVQLPFLQVVLKDFRLVPVIMGNQTSMVYEGLSKALHRAITGMGKRVLVVGSTDLSHYYPYDFAKELDNVIVRLLDNCDTEKMTEAFDAEKCEACGKGPMITTMILSRLLGARKCKVLKYANSGDVSGDKSGVVGYVSAALYKTEEARG